MGCPESVQPFWISREPVAWPWCNLASSQRIPYCASVNSQSAVRRRWLSFFTVWTSQSQWPSEQISFITTMRPPILQLLCRLFWQSITSPRSLNLLQPRFVSLQLLTFPKAKITIEREVICECNGHTVHKLSQRRFTTDLLFPQESDCSWMHSSVSSNWMPSYIKATWLVLKLFKMDRYFLDSPCT